MDTVVLPEPGPPVTRRWPLAPMISSCFSVNFMGTWWQDSASSYGDGRPVTVGWSEHTGIVHLDTCLPEPSGCLRLAALNEEISDAPVALRPCEVVPERSGWRRLQIRVLLHKVR